MITWEFYAPTCPLTSLPIAYLFISPTYTTPTHSIFGIVRDIAIGSEMSGRKGAHKVKYFPQLLGCPPKN